MSLATILVAHAISISWPFLKLVWHFFLATTCQPWLLHSKGSDKVYSNIEGQNLHRFC